MVRLSSQWLMEVYYCHWCYDEDSNVSGFISAGEGITNEREK